jgi:hypothetical protein
LIVTPLPSFETNPCAMSCTSPPPPVAPHQVLSEADGTTSAVPFDQIDKVPAHILRGGAPGPTKGCTAQQAAAAAPTAASRANLHTARVLSGWRGAAGRQLLAAVLHSIAAPGETPGHA